MSLADTANTGTSFQNVPIIDLKNVRSPDVQERKKLADEIRDACVNVGFFYVKNHGVSEALTDGALQMAKEFFDLPTEKKMEVMASFVPMSWSMHLYRSLLLMQILNLKSPNFKGYSPLRSGNNDPAGDGDLQEGFEFGWEEPNPGGTATQGNADGVMAGANVWPTDIPGFRETVLKYYYAAVDLGKALFPIFALALNLPEDFFEDKTQHSAALMKLLHYPPQTGPIDGRVIGIVGRFACFTILWQEPGIQALQVLNSEKQWINAPPISGTLVINLGDQFARWTNDIFKSTVHRAINRSGVRRYSIPLFFGTDYAVKLEPIPSCVSPDTPPKYEVVTAGEYIKSRLRATYNH
ncbi:hypothetical protein NLJ89_g29 [Agrocybe chaxingu]|uniref:Fe2OG dioxygenase domain-containing protein n=1 Tax=Agrocybe chaxingu TaxID=84603 RepID=A0A9W8N2R9_9AGAR|nr:hypothetical protein NLJ89_g29 [Agrocybe chaxingu]